VDCSRTDRKLFADTVCMCVCVGAYQPLQRQYVNCLYPDGFCDLVMDLWHVNK
jgi:hypothetical protein